MAKAKLTMGIIVAIAATLSGCSQQSEIESAVKEQLLDPFSAQFKDSAISSDGNNACISWNAKNRMGGYGGWKVATLKKSDDKWSIDILEKSSLSCTKTALDTRIAKATAKENARAEAEKMIIEGLQKSKSLSFEDAKKATTGDCSVLSRNIIFYSGYIAEEKIAGNQDAKRLEDILARNLTLLEKGDCASAKLFE